MKATDVQHRDERRPEQNRRDILRAFDEHRRHYRYLRVTLVARTRHVQTKSPDPESPELGNTDPVNTGFLRNTANSPTVIFQGKRKLKRKRKGKEIKREKRKERKGRDSERREKRKGEKRKEEGKKIEDSEERERTR